MKSSLRQILLLAFCALAVNCGGNSQSEQPKSSLSQDRDASLNPFQDAKFFVNPYYQGLLAVASQARPDLSETFRQMSEQGGTGVWIVRRDLVPIAGSALQDARKQSEAAGKPVVTSFVVYNLPDRDCAANASAGELTLDQDGLNRYKSEFIDKLAETFQRYPEQRIAVVLEPDSLPNLVTNQGTKRCNDRVFQAYREGVVYALQKLALPNVSIYLDAGHAGWLGWDNNRRQMAQIFREVLEKAGGTHLIRGFATNVSNYTPLVEPDKSIENQSGPYFGWNPAMDELTYVSLLRQDLENQGIRGKSFLIDTGRNGNPRARKVWGNWCNVANAKVGTAPTVAPQEGIDAYVWIKPPGESDGSAVRESAIQPKDPACASGDSLGDAPLAGELFLDHLVRLVSNN